MNTDPTSKQSVAPRFPGAAMVPNLLSLSRLALAVAFPWLPATWRVGVIVLAGFSDLLDGASSRWFRVTSTAGRILDPIADKAFVASVLLTLVTEDRLPLWQLVLIGARDIAVVFGAASLALTRGLASVRNMPPTWLGKLTTVAQFAYLLTVLSGADAAIRVVLAIAAVLSVSSALDYLRRQL